MPEPREVNVIVTKRYRVEAFDTLHAIVMCVQEEVDPYLTTAEVEEPEPAIDCKRVAGIRNRNAERWSNTDRPAPVEEHRASEAGVGDQAQVPHWSAADHGPFAGASHVGVGP
jgi:hypothetical protein